MSQPMPPGVWQPGFELVTDVWRLFMLVAVPVGMVALWTLGTGRSLI